MFADKWNHWLGAAVIGLSLSGHAIAADKVTVFAAASLTNALQHIVGHYEKEKPAIKIVTSYASSSTLARQIVQGAPADLFISADQQWMDYATSKNSIEPRSRYTLLGNDLVLIAPASEKARSVQIDKNTDWKSLLKGQRIATGDPDHVPAGIYAKEALQKLGAWDTLSPLMARANDVHAALALVERDETPYGIIYGSDAVASHNVTVVGHFPENSHKPVEYPMAIVKGHDQPAVSAFYDYLKGPEAAAIFKKYGFIPR